MPTYELRFQVPANKRGDALHAAAFYDSVKWCVALPHDHCVVRHVYLTGGCLTAQVHIEGPSYESALKFVAENTRLVMLRWEMQEFLDAAEMVAVLEASLERAQLD